MPGSLAARTTAGAAQALAAKANPFLGLTKLAVSYTHLTLPTSDLV